ncbi:MAG: MerR family transcriptional regulator [Candidatus Aureabacteria bacterium]|nr:MerR family transcriptional regulator [Candidatus Auribacterota bacterium]
MKMRQEAGAEREKERDYRRPLFPIGVVARLLKVTQTTLRIWEKKGLVRPRRLGKNRFYSYSDYDRLREIAFLLHKKGMNIAGVKDWMRSRCWEIKKCGPERRRCPVFAARGPKIRFVPAGFPIPPAE